MTDFDRFGRRGRPQRVIYTPGSGPLPPKTGQDDNSTKVFYSNYNSEMPTHTDRSAELSKITDKFKKITMSSTLQNEPDENKSSENSKKARKPDYAIYVPKRVAEAHASRYKEKDGAPNEPKPPDIPENTLGKTDRRERNRKQVKKKKGKSSNLENDKFDDDKSLLNSQEFKSRESIHSDEREILNRFTRHGSEPRSLPLTHQDNHIKDLRSIDTSWNHEKARTKPPLGRRGSLSKGKPLPPSFDSLPPRLQKKYIAESGIQDLERISYIGNNNDSWDGSSVTFKGKPSTSTEYNRNSDILKVPNSLSEWSKTLPVSGRGKGRGRLFRDNHNEFHEPVRYTRSLTPETIHSNQFENVPEELIEKGQVLLPKNQNGNNDVLSLKRKLDLNQRSPNEDTCGSSENMKRNSDPSKTEVDKHTDNSDAENILDWAAEVERCEQEDTVQPSDCRGEFLQPTTPQAKDRKKRKSRPKYKEPKDRSLSREKPIMNAFHHGSIDNISNYSRNNSTERNWREHNEKRSRQNSFCDNRSRQNSFCENQSRQSSIERRENFNNRFPRSRQNSSCDNRSRQSSAERRPRRSRREDRNSGSKSKENRNVPKLIEETNWRLEQEMLSRDRERNVGNNTNQPSSNKTAGILVLPQPIIKEGGSSPQKNSSVGNPHPPPQTKKLYDPCNPDKFIVVPTTRTNNEEDNKHLSNSFYPEIPPLINANVAEQLTTKPVWYNPYTENFKVSHNHHLIRIIEQADCELQYLLSTCEVLNYWQRMQMLRKFLKDALLCLLLTDLRFCEIENVEQHFWKILFYNVIELLRKLIAEQPEAKESYKQALLSLIQEGTEYYELLLGEMEKAHNIKLEVFLTTPMCIRENLKYTMLPLIAVQKIYLSLGDLARYHEQANETSNYGLARQWYMKAHQINPKNGRPYNQLAILALYTKRKLDAVYYYMRCLMSSNAISAARESLVTLFDENRKKYETVDRKRKDEKAKKEREKMKEKEGGGGIRREIWVHPGGRKNMHRTTSTCKADYDSEDEELYAASDIEVNKRFVTSYLHVHGKIFTKIGLESLTETAIQMLKQFRALLQHSPLPLNSNRFLQLFALNMFSIEISQPKDDMVVNSEGCYRSATQESALVISLQMFNLLLERFVKNFQDHINCPTTQNGSLPLPPDCLEMLPALKVWCDWLMTHVEIWNPPPSCQDYKVGPPGDCWTRIATLVNLLEKIDYKGDILSTKELPNYELVYLPEDATLSGFTPLMANITEAKYKPKDIDLELAQVSLRLCKMDFLGKYFLCGLDPPVLKLQKVETGDSEYISVVDTENAQEQVLIDENETWSESEDSGKETGQEEDENEVMGLAARRRQLQQQAKCRNSQMARITNALTEMEIRPHDLVPDTNCFIECLPELETILKILPHPQHPYVLMVPLVVVNELEGLSKGCKPSQSAHHSALVRETAKAAMALFQKRHPALRTCTTRGTILSSTTFTLEEDSGIEMTNDDKILTTCVNLCRTFNKDEVKEGGKRKLYRDVVLLTEDRNLALKAMARDMPVRSLPDFIQWAGLG